LRDHFFHDPHFLTWDKYEKVKDHITKMSEDTLKSLDSHLLNMTGYSPINMLETEDKGEKEAKGKKEEKSIIPFPRNWMLPSIPSLQEVKQALGLYTTGGDNELVRFQEDKDGFVLTLDTHLYRPSEIYITVKDDNVNISDR